MALKINDTQRSRISRRILAERERIVLLHPSLAEPLAELQAVTQRLGSLGIQRAHAEERLKDARQQRDALLEKLEKLVGWAWRNMSQVSNAAWDTGKLDLRAERDKSLYFGSWTPSALAGRPEVLVEVVTHLEAAARQDEVAPWPAGFLDSLASATAGLGASLERVSALKVERDDLFEAIKAARQTHEALRVGVGYLVRGFTRMKAGDADLVDLFTLPGAAPRGQEAGSEPGGEPPVEADTVADSSATEADPAPSTATSVSPPAPPPRWDTVPPWPASS